jgi:hypothetical protein
MSPITRPMIRSPTMASTGGGLWVVQAAGMLYDYAEKPNETSIAPLEVTEAVGPYRMAC